MIYHECEYCGATLDPGEHCDCREEYTPPKREEVSRK